jgi:CRISPR-associated protein Cmr2
MNWKEEKNMSKKLLASIFPASIKEKDFNNYIKKLKESTLNEISEDKKAKIEEKGWKYPYYFKHKEDGMPCVNDVMHIYVLISYLTNFEELKKYNKDFIRKKIYENFFNKQFEEDEIKQYIYNSLKNKKNNLFDDIEVDMVKGSIYKIKQYFLEDSRIKDIRGASSIIDHLNIECTLNYLKKNYLEECSVYCGGGNVLIILPKENGEKVCKDLEKKYSEVSLTAKNAFEFTKCKLNDVFFNYNEISRELNEKLESRKKVKVYSIDLDNDIKSLCINGEEIKFEDKRIDTNKVCQLCNARDAKYIVNLPDGETPVCASCMRKNVVGRNKHKFFDEYEKYTNQTIKCRDDIKSLKDLEDDNKNVGVIYADGNNMGNVVRNIDNIFENISFSRTVDNTTKSCVYNSINEVMGENAKFEVIALGGDDIFLIVPADVSIEIALNIIDKFDNAFQNKMTMSVGICITKSNMPIQNSFDISKKCLKNAKKFEKSSKLNEGTLDIRVVNGDGYVWDNLYEKERIIFPNSYTRIRNVVSNIKEIKKEIRNNNKVSKSQFYKLNYAYKNMTTYEFQLFYLYQEGRLSKKYTEYMSKIFDFDNVSFTAGLVKINDKLFSPWQEIIDILNCTSEV